MRTVVQWAGWFLLLPLPLLGQFDSAPRPAPKAEVFGGYSYVRLEGMDLQGWNFSLAGNVNKNLGIVADASGHYDRGTTTDSLGKTTSKLNLNSFMAGPRVTERSNKWLTPFAHALFGMTRINGDVTFTPTAGAATTTSNDQTGFTMAMGGGLDINVSDTVFYRLLQADYYLIRADKIKHEGLRLSAGILFRFGRKSD